jgi:hypothetical protein
LDGVGVKDFVGVRVGVGEAGVKVGVIVRVGVRVGV